MNTAPGFVYYYRYLKFAKSKILLFLTKGSIPQKKNRILGNNFIMTPPPRTDFMKSLFRNLLAILRGVFFYVFLQNSLEAICPEFLL